MEKTFEDEIIGAIKKFTAGYTSVRAAAESLGVTYETFRSWHDGIKSPIYKGQVSASSHTRYDMEMHA